MRFQFCGFAADKHGTVVPHASVSIYKAGTDEPAIVYATQDSTEPLETPPQIECDDRGYFEFWIDSADYPVEQKFKVVIEKEGFEPVVLDDLRIRGISKFTDLEDTPSDLTGHQRKFIRVSDDGSGIVPEDKLFVLFGEVCCGTTFRLNPSPVRDIEYSQYDTRDANPDPSVPHKLWAYQPKEAASRPRWDDGEATHDLAYLDEVQNVSTALDSHRTASPLDHPDGSVTEAKIADGAVTPSKIDSGQSYTVAGLTVTGIMICTGDRQRSVTPFLFEDFGLEYRRRNASKVWAIPGEEKWRVVALLQRTYVIAKRGEDILQEAVLREPGEYAEWNLREGDMIFASKPVGVYRCTEMRPAMPLTVKGTRFAMFVSRYGFQPTFFAPFHTALVRVYDTDGSIDEEFEVRKGITYVHSGWGEYDTVYMIEASSPVVIHKVARGRNDDTSIMIPISTELVGKIGGTAYLCAFYSKTHISVMYDDDTTTEYTLEKGEHVSIGSGSQYTGKGAKIVADKPVACVNRADGDGVDECPFTPRGLWSDYYVLPADSEFLAFASPEMFSIDLWLPGGTVFRFDAEGSANLGIFSRRISAKDVGLERIPAGTVVCTSAPTWAMFEEASSQNETLMLGVEACA